MLKNVLSVIAGLVTGMITISLIHMVSGMIYPMPQGINPSNIEAFNEWLKTMPTGAFILVLFAHSFGAFDGGLVASLIAQKEKKMHCGLIVGAIILVAGIANIMMIWHPLWFKIIDLILYVPAAYIGTKIGMMLKKDKEIN